MKDDFFDESQIKTLFHLLGDENKVNLTEKQINDLCEKILTNFNIFYNDPICLELFNKTCKSIYKMDLNTILNEYQINLDEFETYKMNETLWIDFLTISGLLVYRLEEQLKVNYFENVKEFLECINTLNKSLSLRLNFLK